MPCPLKEPTRDDPDTTATAPTIGVFDSGFGGLTVLRALIERLPHARFAFLGDTARLPYGSKSRRTIARYAARERAVSGSRAGRGVSGHRLQHRQRPCPRRHPGCRAGSGAGRDRAWRHGRRAASRTGDVLVIATEATVHSHAYAAACQARGLRAMEKACPLLVPLVEEGWTDHPVTAEVIDIYLNELRAEAAAQGMGPDTLVLGCTHYPLLRPLIRRRGAARRQGDRFCRSGRPGSGRALQPACCRPRQWSGSGLQTPHSRPRSLLRHRFGGEVRAARLAIPRAARWARGVDRPGRLNPADRTQQNVDCENRSDILNNGGSAVSPFG